MNPTRLATKQVGDREASLTQYGLNRFGVTLGHQLWFFGSHTAALSWFDALCDGGEE